MPAAPLASKQRDPRIDVLRGLSLLMIFVDHIPADWLNRVTLHNFGFCDAAEIFVLLAGFSSMLAYGKTMQRDGVRTGLRKICIRCARIYLYQIALMVLTLGIIVVWTRHFHFTSHTIAPILGAPVAALTHGVTLRALPRYLDILPLYIVLLAAFPIIYFAIRRSVWLALAGSGMVWLVANLDPAFNLPNWIDGQGWYFHPFAWQFLFTIGAVMAVFATANNGGLPVVRELRCLAMAFLAFAFVQTFQWKDWGLPNLALFAMAPPDKSLLVLPRIADILALMYLILSDPRTIGLARQAWLRPLEACGRHSLEVFAAGCVLALFGRLAFRTEGAGSAMQVAVNVTGFGLMILLGWWLERGRSAGAAVKQTVQHGRYSAPSGNDSRANLFTGPTDRGAVVPAAGPVPTSL